VLNQDVAVYCSRCSHLRAADAPATVSLLDEMRRQGHENPAIHELSQHLEARG